ncbi:hypothetical protein OGAPHI_006856, partial [Ogataea philodendri]
ISWNSGDNGGRLAVGVGGGDVGDNVGLDTAVSVRDHSGSVLTVVGWRWVGGCNRGWVTAGISGGDVGDNVGLDTAVRLGHHSGVNRARSWAWNSGDNGGRLAVRVGG